MQANQQANDESEGAWMTLSILRKAAPKALTIRDIQGRDKRGCGYIRIWNELKELERLGLAKESSQGLWIFKR